MQHKHDTVTAVMLSFTAYKSQGLYDRKFSSDTFSLVTCLFAIDTPPITEKSDLEGKLNHFFGLSKLQAAVTSL
jgi:hypothetical protein